MLPVHGVRAAYLAGCRCLPCRAAHAATVATYRRQPSPLQPAAPILAHLQQLRAVGLGTRQIARLAHVGAQVVTRLLTGRQTTLRAATAAQLAAVRPCLAHGACVPGTKTHRFIDSLAREGYTRQRIAFALGARSHQLQLHRTVRVSSALKMATVYAQLTT